MCSSCKTSMPINLIAARRQAHWTKVYASGLFSVRQNDVRANDVSGKRSAERRFVKMTFGWTTIRENDVRLKNGSEKYRSTLWSFTNSTIDHILLDCAWSYLACWLNYWRFVGKRQIDNAMRVSRINNSLGE